MGARAASFRGVGGEAQGLHRQDREDAGHQVQDDAAQERRAGRQRQAGDPLPARKTAVTGRGHRTEPRGGGRQGPRLGVDLEGLAVDDQQAIQGLGRGAGLEGVARLQGQSQAAGAAHRGLGLGLVDDAGGEGVEIDLPDGGAVQRRAEHRQLHHAALEAHGALQGWPLGRRGQGRGDGGVGGDRGRCGDRQAQLQGRVLGHADVLADQDRDGGLQRRGLAHRRGLGRGDRDRQPHLAFVAVVHQGPDGQALGRRPHDVACRPAGRQRPGQLGRLAGVAGIAPIGVPAGPDLLVQGHVEGLPGGDGGGGRDQLELDVAGIGHGRLRPARNEQAKDDKPDADMLHKSAESRRRPRRRLD